MNFATLGALASQLGDYTLWDHGNNPHGYYFLGMYCATESGTTWTSMYGYDMLIDDYIYMEYANRVGSGIGVSGYLACEDAIDLSKYSAVEITAQAPSAVTISVGSVENVVLGEAFAGWTAFEGSQSVSSETTFQIPIPASAGTVHPVIRTHTGSNHHPQVKIKKWRLLK